MTPEGQGAGQPQGYLAYLLRLWREMGGETTRWRASLEDPHSGDKLGFAHLDELVAFLRERTGLAPPEESPKRERPSSIGSESEEGGSE
ncbi:MAG: hypothetical protein PVH59_15360 [Anaerolineae bacterium]|jgi:hypothetical protein